jgi:protein SCO1/2
MPSACARQPSLHGTALNPPPAAKTFTLRDQYGNAYSLQQSRGQAVALYFGFTHCADICPQTLARLGKAREQAGLSAHQLRIVMITIDPARDSGKALQTFFRKIGVDATGLRGTPQQLHAVYRAYGVAVMPERNDIGHTDTIFLIDARGRLRELLDPATPLNDVAADLRAIVD